MQKTVVVYARYSSDIQHKDSIDTQLKAIKSFSKQQRRDFQTGKKTASRGLDALIASKASTR